jgi:tetratricopeptide (TPR) repeat protein
MQRSRCDRIAGGQREPWRRKTIMAPGPAALALVALLLSAGAAEAAPATSAAPASEAGQPESVAALLASCDQHYHASELQASRAAAEQALDLDPGSYPAHWKLARVLIDLGNKAEKKEDRQRLYEAAEAQARRAVALRDDDTWGHHYLAASVGKLALFHGGKTKIELSKEVRDEAERAVALDPTNDKSYHILGRWNREVANLSAIKKLAAKVVYGGVPKGASEEKAVEYFQRAISLAPAHINHHLELGITYFGMEKYDQAIAEFERCLELPRSDPNDPDYQAEAQRMLEKAKRRVSRPREDKSR